MNPHFFKQFKDIPIKKILSFLIRRCFRLKQRIPKRLFDEKESINKCLSSYSTSMKYFIEYDEFYARVRSLGKTEKILDNANLILNNRLPILTKEVIELGEDIRWNYDYVKDVEISSLKDAKANGSDIKRIWELSRLHQLTPLCKAYIITQEEIYKDKIRSIVTDWIDKNPYYKGPNWINPMEISIRCANIINALFLCPELKEEGEWLKQVNKLLFWSGTYVRYHLENTTLVNNNHYMSDLFGLLVISLYFSGTVSRVVNKEVSEWLRFSYKELNSEIKQQILKDGGTFEKSTSYHAYVLELLLVSKRLLQKNTEYDITDIAKIVERMWQYIARFNHGNTIPFIGDSDNTRLYQFSDDYPYENQRSYKILFEELEKETGKESSNRNCFKYSGHYFLQNGKIDVLVNCGKVYANGGHCHNDQLSFILWYDGIQLSDDPGTFCYTSDPEKRNLFRGTAAHSTVMVDEKEQNELIRTFEIKERTNSECVDYSDSYFKGRHQGYTEIGAIVEREIFIQDESVRIHDVVSSGNHCISRIVLTPDTREVGKLVFQTKGITFKISSNSDDITVIQIPYSPSYGAMCETTAIELSFSKEHNFSIDIKSGH